MLAIACHLDGQRLRFLSFVRVKTLSIDSELAELFSAQPIFRKHAFDGFLYHKRRASGEELAIRLCPKASWKSRMSIVEFLVELCPGELDFPGVDNDHEIPRISMKRVLGTMLPSKDGRNFGCQPTQRNPGGIDDVPSAS